MSKKSQTIQRAKKIKDFSFVMRIIIFCIFIGGIVVSSVFTTIYLKSNSQLSIEFAGGYQVETTYDGVSKDSSKTKDVVKLLESRVDPLGTSNIDIKKLTGDSNTYTVSVSSSANITLQQLINSTERRGYLYLIDEQGHDLLNENYSAKKWSPRTKRLILKDAFSKISQGTNSNSHQPELVLDIKDQDLIKEIGEIGQDQTNHITLYSDIGQVLNFARNSYEGLKILVKEIDDTKDAGQQAAMKYLLASNTPGFSSDKGDAIYEAVKRDNSALKNLLNQANNGINSIDWIYSDVKDTTTPLSYDPNDEKNVFDPSSAFTDKTEHSSPMNAWLPVINDLIQNTALSNFFNTTIINSDYAPYFIGKVESAVNGQVLKINDDTFNEEKVRQISSLLNAGEAKNDFRVMSYRNVNPTFGANALKVVVIGLLVTLAVASILVMFKYRFLGFYAILMIIGFLCFTLVMFAFLNNIFSPETGIALIISFALLLDAIIGLLSRLQSEYKTGKTVFNAFKAANKKSTSAAFDGNIIVLIFSLTIFWFGTRSIKGFAIMTSLATFGVIIFGILLFRIGLYFFLKNSYFEQHPALLALTHSSAEEQSQTLLNKKQPGKLELLVTKPINQMKKAFSKPTTKMKLLLDRPIFHPTQWNFWHKTTKWILTGFGVILVGSAVTYLAAGANYGQGFESKISMIGSGTYNGDPGADNYNIKAIVDQYQQETIDKLNEKKQNYVNVYSNFVLNTIGPSGATVKIVVETNLTNLDKANNLREILKDSVNELTWTYSTYNSLAGSQLFNNMLIAIAVSLVSIFIYVIIRFQLTFTIPLIIAMVFGTILTLATVALFQVTITTMLIGVLLGVVTLILINSVVIFDNIKELKLHTGTNKNSLTTTEITDIANSSIKKSLSRTFSINSIIILASLLVMCFIPSFWAVSLSIIIGTIIAFLSTHFVAPWLWTFFERWRIKRAKKRIEKIKKNFVAADEYIIPGIND